MESIFKVARLFEFRSLADEEELAVFRRNPDEDESAPSPSEEAKEEPAEDKPLEYGSKEYEELSELEVKQPAAENYQKAVNKAVNMAANEMGLEQSPDIVALSIDGRESEYWVYDSGLGYYRAANNAVGIDVSSKELTQLTREEVENKEPSWREKMYAE